MDWFTWLSKTTLDPALVYDYALTFARNELEYNDIPYFNHEFLHSMGILVAKHRLEIIKLAKKEERNGLSKFISAINKTKRRITGRINKWVFHRELHQEKAIVKTKSIAKSGPIDARVQEKLMLTSRSIKLSGPLDGKVQEKLLYTPCKSPLYGPHDPRRKGDFNRSPMITGPPKKGPPSPITNGEKHGGVDCYDHHSIWATLFHDMKPT